MRLFKYSVVEASKLVLTKTLSLKHYLLPPSRNCPKNVRNCFSRPLRTIFGQSFGHSLSTFFGHFVEIHFVWAVQRLARGCQISQGKGLTFGEVRGASGEVWGASGEVWEISRQPLDCSLRVLKGLLFKSLKIHSESSSGERLGTLQHRKTQQPSK